MHTHILCTTHLYLHVHAHNSPTQYILSTYARPCNGLAHCGGQGSRPGQSVWDLWLRKWHRVIRFPLSVSFHRGAILIYNLGDQK
jgi:hypothetical protein